MLLRLVTGIGLLALGYYVGRELKHTSPIREKLKQARDEGKIEALHEIDKDSPRDDGDDRSDT